MLGIYNLLYLELDDGKTVLAHLEEETDKIKEEFKIEALSFDELKNKLLAPYNNILENLMNVASCQIMCNCPRSRVAQHVSAASVIFNINFAYN